MQGMLSVKPGTDATVDNSGNGRADIGVPRGYINPARHVRAFGVGLGLENDGYDKIERGIGRSPQAAIVSLLAPRNPRDGPDPRPLCRCRDCDLVRRRAQHSGAPDRSTRSRSLCGADRRRAAAAGACERAVRAHQGLPSRGSERMKPPAKSPAALLAPGRALTFANVAEGAEGLIVSDLARAIAARPNPPAISLAVVCRDGPRMQQLARSLEFFAPDL